MSICHNLERNISNLSKLLIFLFRLCDHRFKIIVNKVNDNEEDDDVRGQPGGVKII